MYRGCYFAGGLKTSYLRMFCFIGFSTMMCALQVSSERSTYCRKINREFVEKLNRKNPKTMDKIEDLWYEETSYSKGAHYNPTRYQASHFVV